LPVPSRIRLLEHGTSIEGGTRAGPNLLHSFAAFSVPSGDRVEFAAQDGIQNILARVTGSLPSQLDGTLAVAGTARLILLNPNGIRFGNSAQLEISGTLVATTAERVVLADGQAFGVGATPLLSVAVPLGVQFGTQAAPLTAGGPGAVRSDRPLFQGDDLGEPLNLGQGLTAGGLHLIGGSLMLDGALLQATEVALVAGSPQSRVSLGALPVVQGGQGDVVLRNNALVYTEGGPLSVQGQNVGLLEGSRLESRIANQDGSPIVVQVQDTLTATGRSPNAGGAERYVGGIVTTSELRGTGNVGPLTVAAQTIRLGDGGSPIADTFGLGKAGAIALTATQKLVAQDAGRISSSAPRAFGQGNNIAIKADTVHLQNGFQVTAIARGANARGEVTPGNIAVQARTLTVEGVQPGTDFPSGFFTSSLGGSIADAGNIKVVTDRLYLRQGGQINSQAGSFGTGSAGSIDIVARERVELEGLAAGEIPSGMFVVVEPFSFGNAGRITLTTPILQMNDRAEISVGSNTEFTTSTGGIPNGIGAAGSLEIRAGETVLDGGGRNGGGEPRQPSN
jgi:filamentous hemagglutinin family protein